MTVSYEVWLVSTGGVRIDLLEGFTSLRWNIGVNATGSFAFKIPPQNFDFSLFGVDRRIEIYRKVTGAASRLIPPYFLRRPTRQSVGDKRTTELRGPGMNELLLRRIIAADAGTAEARKTGPVDDVMKEFVDEAMGPGAIAARDLSGTGFTVQADLGQGPALTKSASRRQLLMVLQELSEQSIQAGTPIFFDIVYFNPTSFQFQTFLNQRGIDRTFGGGGSPILLSEDLGNLINPILVEDYSTEVNFVYAAGKGTEGTRSEVTVSDAARIAVSPFNRREGLFDGRNTPSADLGDAGDQRLRQGEPFIKFDGVMVEQDNLRFGIDWNLGDKVTALYQGDLFDSHIVGVNGIMRSDGQEIITARLLNVTS